MPTDTPSTRTVDPGYTPMVLVKYAVTCVPGLPEVSTSPAEISAMAAATAVIAMILAPPGRGGQPVADMSQHQPPPPGFGGMQPLAGTTAGGEYAFGIRPHR